MGPCEVCGSKADTVVAFPVSLGDHFLGVMRVCRNASFAPAHDRELCRAALVKRWIREGVTL